MLDVNRIQAITLDLDDTLWPIGPAIARAEQALVDWLGLHAPLTAALFSQVAVRLGIRESIVNSRPDLAHKLGAIRREMIRTALSRAGENPLLVDPGYEVFFAERNRVTLVDDALAALAFLSARFPLVALSNGNADIARIGIERYFCASISAQDFGIGKPDPRIFQAAAAAAQVLPANVLHIGDDAQLDVLGALHAGMQAVWVNPAAHPWAYPDTRPHLTVQTLTELCDAIQGR